MKIVFHILVIYVYVECTFKFRMSETETNKIYTIYTYSTYTNKKVYENQRVSFLAKEQNFEKNF